MHSLEYTYTHILTHDYTYTNTHIFNRHIYILKHIYTDAHIHTKLMHKYSHVYTQKTLTKTHTNIFMKFFAQIQTEDTKTEFFKDNQTGTYITKHQQRYWYSIQFTQQWQQITVPIP